MLLWHFIFICVGNVAPRASTFLVPEKWPYKTPCEISPDLSNGSGSVITSLGKQLPGWQAVFLWRIGTTPRHIYCAAGSTQKSLCIHKIQAQNGSNGRLFILTRTHIFVCTQTRSRMQWGKRSDPCWRITLYYAVMFGLVLRLEMLQKPDCAMNCE